MTSQRQTGPPMLARRVEEMYYTVNFSRVEGEEEAAIIPELRKDVEKEIQKGENKAFICKAVIRDPQSR